MIKTGLSILLIAALSGCGGKSAKVPKTFTPTSHQVTFIESSSSAEMMVRSTGLGKSIASAHTDATRAAVWFALYGGSNPLLQTREEKKAFSQIKESFFKNAANYITFNSGIKGKQKNGSTYSVTYTFRINTALLKNKLIEMKVMKETTDLLDGMDLPQIAVVSLNSNEKNSLGVVSEYLIDRDFEVKKVSGINTDKIFLKIAQTISVDPLAAQMYANALSSGSDIYITTDVKTSSRKVGIDKVKKASIVLHAYYTATNKEIAATTGYSQERVVSSYSSVIAEATNDAADKLLNQIQKSWKKEVKKGKAYKVIVTAQEEMVSQLRRPLYNMMKKSCTKVVPNKTINNIFDYTLFCKNVANYQELEMILTDNYTGAGQVFLQSAKGALLVLKVANSEDEEIEIE